MRDCCDGSDSLFGLIRFLFAASAVTCFLYAAHRIANGLVLTGQVAAFDSLEDAYTPEERELLIHKIKHNSYRF